MKKTILLLFLVFMYSILCAQNKEQTLPVKVSHAEPIYFDLIRELGARKGERELNVGMGVASHSEFSEYTYLIEYEFAPINRLGLEIEIPLAFHNRPVSDSEPDSKNGIEGIKTAMQYSFLVCEKSRMTMAAGYIFEKRLTHSLPKYTHTPFIVVAKRWGSQWHTMIYGGPFYSGGHEGQTEITTIVNASVHYTLPGTKNFVGVEMNDEFVEELNTWVLRPQIRMTLSSTSCLGISIGIASYHAERLQDFLIRWIYEPKKKKK